MKYLKLLVGILICSNVMSQNIPNYIPSNGLVGWWPFNGNAIDESGNGNNGVVNGATLTSDRNSLSNKCYNFDGISNFIKVPSSSILNCNNAISISCWTYQNINSNTQKIVSRERYLNGVSYDLGITNQSIDFAINNDGGNCGQSCNKGISSSTGVLNNQWQNFIVTWDGSTMKLYINGVLKNSQSSTLANGGKLLNSIQDLFFGKWMTNNSNYPYNFFKGKIDDIGMWNRALTQQEISNLYNSSASPKLTICQKIGSDSLSLYKNGYITGPQAVGSQPIHTDSKWIKTSGVDTLYLHTMQHRLYDKSKIYDKNNNLIWTWGGESVPATTWYPRNHKLFISGNDSVRLEFYQGYTNFSVGHLQVIGLYCSPLFSSLSSTKVYVDAPATVKQNDTLQLSISTETLNTSDNVISYQTDFSYDSTRYTFLSNNLVGTLNPSGNVAVNSSKKGKLSISYMSQTALSGTGSLVKLKFKANNTLGQGIFDISNFMYNNTTVTSTKSDTVNTIDGIPPTAKITYSQNPVRKGDSLLITVKFNEKMAVSPVPQLNLTGQNTLVNSNLTMVNDTTYTYWWVVEKGNGTVNVNLATGKDLGGNVIVTTPTQNPSFTVLPTLFGDIDTNTFVRAYDAALALQYSVGLNPLPTMDPLPWSNWRLAVANVDTVGNVTANDASLILQHSAKLISSFPADAKKRGGDAPTAVVTVTQEGNQLVFRATGTLYAFNVYMKDNFKVLGQPDVKNKSAIVASKINTTTYNVGIASTTPLTENEPFLTIPILTNDNLQGTMDIVANTNEESITYGATTSIYSINKEAVVVYPNPTKDVVTINNAQGKTVRIVDVQGKEVYNQKVNSTNFEISMKSIVSKGTYILHMLDVNNETIQTKQIVLE